MNHLLLNIDDMMTLILISFDPLLNN